MGAEAGPDVHDGTVAGADFEAPLARQLEGFGVSVDLVDPDRLDAGVGDPRDPLRGLLLGSSSTTASTGVGQRGEVGERPVASISSMEGSTAYTVLPRRSAPVGELGKLTPPVWPTSAKLSCSQNVSCRDVMRASCLAARGLTGRRLSNAS